MGIRLPFLVEYLYTFCLFFYLEIEGVLLSCDQGGFCLLVGWMVGWGNATALLFSGGKESREE